MTGAKGAAAARRRLSALGVSVLMLATTACHGTHPLPTSTTTTTTQLCVTTTTESATTTTEPETTTTSEPDTTTTSEPDTTTTSEPDTTTTSEPDTTTTSEPDTTTTSEPDTTTTSEPDTTTTSEPDTTTTSEPDTTTTTTAADNCVPCPTTTTTASATTTSEPDTTTTSEPDTTTTSEPDTTTTSEPETTTTSEPETTTTSEPDTTTTSEPDTTTTTEPDTTTTSEPDTTTTTEPATTTTTSDPANCATTTTSGSTTTSASSTTTTTTNPPTGSQPDVLFVMLDDESPDTTPYYMPRTFEKMTGEHWYNFTQAVVPTPLCGPVRSTLLTGQTVDHHDLNCNVNNGSMCNAWGARRDQLIPKALANAGAWVGWYGKRVNWDHECTKFEGAPKGWPNLPGVVDDHVHYVDTQEMFNQYQLVENGVVNSYNVATQGPTAYGTYKTADLTLTGIENCVSPCTLYWMPMAPHAPGTPPPDYDASKVLPGVALHQPPFNEGCPGATDPDFTDKPYQLQNYAPCAGVNAWKRTKTAASLQGVDNRLPELIDAFLAKNPENGKRIIFTSDHGRQLGNHRHIAKEDPYEMSVRVPLFIYDSEAPGGTVDTLVNLRDLPATLLDWQQATPLLPLDGRSLVPLYTGTATDWYTDTYMSHLLVSNAIDQLRAWYAVRQDCVVAAAEQRHCLKVVRYPAATLGIAGLGQVSFPEEWEVYLLDQDPWELTNVYANSFTGYAGVPGWDDTNPELAAAKASLAAHQLAGH